MILDLTAYLSAITSYWTEIAKRGQTIQDRERAFSLLASRFEARKPPHFVRTDLHEIIVWKHTDARRQNKALEGLQAVSDEEIETLTTRLDSLSNPCSVAAAFRGRIKGAGIATVSAVLAAARPSLFPVIDVFALEAAEHYYDPSWLRVVPRDANGRFAATFETYGPFTQFCRERVDELTTAGGQDWTPRRVDMALWAIGKDLLKQTAP